MNIRFNLILGLRWALHHDSQLMMLSTLIPCFYKKAGSGWVRGGTVFSTAYQLLGREVRNMSNPLQSLVVIRDGLPVLFSKKRGAPKCFQSVYAQLIGVSLISIQRMKRANMQLSPASSEHVLMLTDLVVQCDSYFDDIEKRNHWLNCPNLSLGNATPISICDTAMGIKLVSEAIVKLKSGFVA